MRYEDFKLKLRFLAPLQSFAKSLNDDTHVFIFLAVRTILHHALSEKDLALRLYAGNVSTGDIYTGLTNTCTERQRYNIIIYKSN